MSGNNRIMKITTLALSVLLLFSLVSCFEVFNTTEDENIYDLHEGTEISELSEEEKEKSVDDIIAETANTLGSVVNNEIVVSVFADDFDGDGVSEAYAMTSVYPVPEGATSANVSLWFVKKDFAEKLHDAKNLVLKPKIWDFGDKKLFCTVGNNDGKIISTVYFVAENAAYSYAPFDGELYREGDDGINFYLAKKDFDKNLNVVSQQSYGETTKSYYLYFDGNFFCEYGGSEVRDDQLRTINGADTILSALTKGGYTIDEIYYRERKTVDGTKNERNGIFNINISKMNLDGSMAQENVTLIYDGNEVRLVPIADVTNPFAFIENENLAQSIISGSFSNPSQFSFGGKYVSTVCEDIAEYSEF